MIPKVAVDGEGGKEGTAHEKNEPKEVWKKKRDCLVDAISSSFSYHKMKQLALHRLLFK